MHKVSATHSAVKAADVRGIFSDPPKQEQLLIIDEVGRIQSLQFKAGKGLDIRELGHAKIVRSSLIEWNETAQAWYIKLLHYKGIRNEWDGNTPYVVGGYLWETVGLERPVGLRGNPTKGDHYLFTDYEDAATAEVALIQALRAKYGPHVV